MRPYKSPGDASVAQGLNSLGGDPGLSGGGELFVGENQCRFGLLLTHAEVVRVECVPGGAVGLCVTFAVSVGVASSRCERRAMLTARCNTRHFIKEADTSRKTTMVSENGDFRFFRGFQKSQSRDRIFNFLVLVLVPSGSKIERGHRCRSFL